MTPELCIGLAAVLLEFRNWLNEEYPGNLDAVLVDGVVDVLVRVRAELLREGAR